MRYIFLFLLLSSSAIKAQKSIYGISVQSESGKTVSLGDYKTKKMIIGVFSVTAYQNKQTKQYWDSVKASNPNINVLLMVAADLEMPGSAAANFTNELPVSTSFETTKISSKKSNGVYGSEIVNWLSSTSLNNHFSADLVTDERLYFISESGVLYAVLERGASAKIINELINQQDVKQ
jgi:hypothetical protein